jgi:hypothetical protein
LFCSDSRARNDHGNVCISKPTAAIPKYKVGAQNGNKHAWKSGHGSSTIYADLLFVHLYDFQAGNGIKK